MIDGELASEALIGDGWVGVANVVKMPVRTEKSGGLDGSTRELDRPAGDVDQRARLLDDIGEAMPLSDSEGAPFDNSWSIDWGMSPR